MFGLRWRSSSLLALLAVFALCFGSQHSPTVSAKDKVDAKDVATADPTGSATTDANDRQSTRGKSSASTSKKKARPETKKKKKGDSEDSDSGTGTTAQGKSSGGFLPPVPGGTSGAPANNSNPGAGGGKTGQNQPTAGTAPVKTTGTGNSGKPSGGKGGPGKGTGGGAANQAAAAANQGPNPEIVKKVMDVQNRHHAELGNQKGVVGTSTGVDEDGNVVIRVYTSGADNPKIPAQIENVAVKEVLTGPIHSYQSQKLPTRRLRLPRAIAIGVSAISDPGFGGDQDLCASGTYGCRLVDKATGKIYGLSNNHVWAEENAAPLGTPAVQPSAGDGQKDILTGDCLYGLTFDQIGRLAAFVPLDFTDPMFNFVDAAVILSDKFHLGTSTLKDGYGVPTSTTVQPFLTQIVQKYGRTTGYTRGIVTGINVLVTVGYTAGPADFFQQIEVEGDEENGFVSLGAPGDSGSLVVDLDRNPVGLLFAGGGGITFCNRIDNVLNSLSFILSLIPGNPDDVDLVIDSSRPTIEDKNARSTPDSP